MSSKASSLCLVLVCLASFAALQTSARPVNGTAKPQFISLVKLTKYGNYCGAGHSGPGKPIDKLDSCCKAHDACFTKNCDPCIKKCNQAFSSCVAAVRKTCSWGQMITSRMCKFTSNALAYGRYEARCTKGRCSPCKSTCKAGTFCNTRTKKCQNCAAGTYTKVAQQTKCLACPSGTYQDKTGQSSCKSCPGQTKTGQTNCPDEYCDYEYYYCDE